MAHVKFCQPPSARPSDKQRLFDGPFLTGLKQGMKFAKTKRLNIKSTQIILKMTWVHYTIPKY